MIERILGANKHLREHRAKKHYTTRFKFWYEIKSGSQLATEFMNLEEAASWIKTNHQNIVGIQVIERMSNEEALKYLKVNMMEIEE